VRAPSEIADEIAAYWFGGRISREVILREMHFVQEQAARFDGLDVTQIRRKAKAAERAIRDVFDGKDPPLELRKWAILKGVEGPDKRLDTLAWLCAQTACYLIDTYGDGKPAGTQDGCAHGVTQMFYEAISGRPQTETSCLSALRSVIAWRKLPAP
jgi:hypothetical protein